ncbi:MAG: SAM-dependent methyltransferase [Gammaproteobacteria bacterium]|nr:SAM-dependent methyltransferase [Gammaproteobacteria bacterium]
MRLTAETLAYLRGERFSNDLVATFALESGDAVYESRFDVLTRLVAGRQVIHVGCVDHGVAGIRKKMEQGRWLHEALHGVAARCFGVDLDEEGIEYMRDTLGYVDAAALDILEDPCEPLMAQHWDYLLLPEVLEHIGDPVRFLAGLRQRFIGRVEELVVTVPNGFSHRNAREARRNVERINSDHRFWFTPYTLAKVAMDARLSPRRFSLCHGGPLKPLSPLRPRGLMDGLYCRRYPLLRNSIVMHMGFE